MKMFTAIGALLLISGPAFAQSGPPRSFPGNNADLYVLSDAASEVYQYERTSPFAYVPGNFPGIAKPLVFTNASQLLNNAPYLGCVADPNQDFFIGGFSGLQKINGSTGAFISTIAGGSRLGPATAPNGNVVVGGPSGVEEFDSTTGALVRTVNNYGNGNNIFAFNGNTMFTGMWGIGGTSIVKQFDFVSGSQIGADISVPFVTQKLAIGPDGALYTAALYSTPTFEGVYRYNGTSWVQFVNTNALGGGGPHAFAWDPISLDLFVSQNTGEIYRFDGITGAYLSTVDTINTKLTDILFKVNVPGPGALAVLGLGGLLAARRRR